MAAKSSKAAKDAAAAAAPYVRRVMSDEELRDNVRVAIDSAREAFARLQSGKGPAKVVLDDKKFKKSVQEAATALKDASDSLRDAPKQRKRGGGLFGKLLLVLIAAGIALAVNEDLRNKVLDALFGKEEEFDYSAPTENGTVDTAATASTPAA
ncbi:MAG TPA: hypothetical protein VFB41_04855 [Solirubrobacteraceae bacterium]|nr:hypothetical protein [Solirubrobacteraceae bacterium]